MSILALKQSENIAKEFDPTRTSSNPYAAGECVWHGDTLYRFTASHYGAWTGLDAVTAVVSDEVGDLKSAITQAVTSNQMQKCTLVEVPKSANLWNKDAAQVGFLHKDGTVYTGGTYDNYKYASIGEVNEGDILNFYINYNGSGSIYAINVQYVVCYNSSGEVLSSSGIGGVNTYTVPSGVSSIKLTIQGGENNNFMALKNNASAPSAYIPYYEAYSYYVAKTDFIHNAYLAESEEITGKVGAIYEASASDQGKVLQAKTVSNGEVTEWDFVPSNDPSVLDNYVSKTLMQNCELKNYPKSENLWDNAHKNPGWYHKNGTIYDYEGFYYYDIGSVTEGDVLHYYFVYSSGTIYDGTIYTAVCKDSDGNIMPSVSGGGASSFTVPAGVASVVITIDRPDETTMIIKNGQRPTAFIPYYEAYSAYIAKEEFIKDITEEEDIILNVPSKIYAVVGVELNVYFENITDEWMKYKWNVTCTKGKQMQRCYTITPVLSDIGSYSLTIRASVDEKTYKEITTTLVIASAGAADGVSIIVLGDSTTDYGLAVTKIHTDFDGMNTTVQTLGTRGTSPNNHEGRSGWKAYDYLTVQSRDGVTNAFYNPTSQTFDASYYFTNSGVSVPDWFFINLGINDVFGYTTDTGLNSGIATIIGYYDTMIESLKDAEPSMKIGVCVTISPNDSQDAFGKAYACGQTRDRYKRNNAIWAAKLIEHYANKESEGIYLVPIHVNLDTVYNMGMETLPVNARNTSVTYESPIGNGGVHPVESGYWQIADVYTAFLKANAE